MNVESFENSSGASPRKPVASFGCFEFQMFFEAFDVGVYDLMDFDGKITDASTPWSQQFHDDMKALSSLPDYEDWWENIHEHISANRRNI